jgi:hypothetical protein
MSMWLARAASSPSKTLPFLPIALRLLVLVVVFVDDAIAVAAHPSVRNIADRWLKLVAREPPRANRAPHRRHFILVFLARIVARAILYI